MLLLLDTKIYFTLRLPFVFPWEEWLFLNFAACAVVLSW